MFTPAKTSRAAEDEAAPLGESSAISVVVRVRPLTVSERRAGGQVAWEHDEKRIWQTANAGPGARSFTPASPYDYDRVYGPAATTEQIHAESVRHSVARTLQGFHATVFAYGQTSSGKTTTIRGGAGSEGLIPLSVRQVLEGVAEAQKADAAAGGPVRRWSLKMAYLEIYNETIGDLLTGQAGLPIYEKKDGSIHVQDLSEQSVSHWAQAERLLAAGDDRRHVGCTQRNDESSRAHTIFRLSVGSSVGEPQTAGYRATVAELNIVDLAGSERASPHLKTGGAAAPRDASGRDVRTTEMCSINKSLLVLGTVVQKLAEAASAGGGGPPAHVPYRSSKLTRLLQNSLGGEALCTIVCNLTPASSYAEETHNTLRFAARARTVRNLVVCHERLDPSAALRKLEAQVSTLKKSLAASEAARHSLGALGSPRPTPQQAEGERARVEKLERAKRAAEREAEACTAARDESHAARAEAEQRLGAAEEGRAAAEQARHAAEARGKEAAARAERAEREAAAAVEQAQQEAARERAAAARAAAEAAEAARRAKAAEAKGREAAEAAAEEARREERATQRHAASLREARLEQRLAKQAEERGGEAAAEVVKAQREAEEERRRAARLEEELRDARKAAEARGAEAARLAHEKEEAERERKEAERAERERAHESRERTASMRARMETAARVQQQQLDAAEARAGAAEEQARAAAEEAAEARRCLETERARAEQQARRASLLQGQLATARRDAADSGAAAEAAAERAAAAANEAAAEAREAAASAEREAAEAREAETAAREEVAAVREEAAEAREAAAGAERAAAEAREAETAAREAEAEAREAAAAAARESAEARQGEVRALRAQEEAEAREAEAEARQAEAEARLALQQVAQLTAAPSPAVAVSRARAATGENTGATAVTSPPQAGLEGAGEAMTAAEAEARGAPRAAAERADAMAAEAEAARRRCGELEAALGAAEGAREEQAEQARQASAQLAAAEAAAAAVAEAARRSREEAEAEAARRQQAEEAAAAAERDRAELLEQLEALRAELHARPDGGRASPPLATRSTGVTLSPADGAGEAADGETAAAQRSSKEALVETAACLWTAMEPSSYVDRMMAPFQKCVPK